MRNWRQQLHLVWYKAYSDLLAEVSRGSIGLLWWVLEPVLYLGAFYVIFELAFKRGGEGFVPFLLVGLTTWKWFASSITNASNSITQAKGLISQVYVPKIMFPIAVVLVTSFKFLIIFILLLGFLALSGYLPDLHWLAIPLILFLQLLVITAAATLVAAIVPVLPDLKLIINNLLLMMFFLSGVFFDLSQLDGTTAGEILALNPMAIMIDSYRAVLLDHQWPHWGDIQYVTLLSLFVITLSVMLHKRLDREYPKFI